jgi:hypothetical protein
MVPLGCAHVCLIEVEPDSEYFPVGRNESVSKLDERMLVSFLLVETERGLSQEMVAETLSELRRIGISFLSFRLDLN